MSANKPYIIGLTDMSIPLYLLLTGVCRLPSILLSTVGGDALGENRWGYALIFFALAAVISLCGYWIYGWIRARQNKRSGRASKNRKGQSK